MFPSRISLAWISLAALGLTPGALQTLSPASAAPSGSSSQNGRGVRQGGAEAIVAPSGARF